MMMMMEGFVVWTYTGPWQDGMVNGAGLVHC